MTFHEDIERMIYQARIEEALTLITRHLSNPRTESYHSFQLELLKGKALMIRGNVMEAKNRAEHVLQWARKNEQTGMVIEALTMQGEALWRMGQLEEASNILQTAKNLLDSLPRETETEFLVDRILLNSLILAHLSTVHANKGDVENAVRLAEIAVEMARNREVKSNVYIYALNVSGIALWLRGRLEEAISRYEEALSLARELDNLVIMAQVLNNMGLIYWTQGQLHEALTNYEQSLRLSKRIGNDRIRFANLLNIGLIYQQKGDLDAALKYCHEALDLIEKMDDPINHALSLDYIGNIYRIKGELEVAKDYLIHSLRLQETIGNIQDIARVRLHLAAIYLQSGQLTEALDQAQKSLSLRQQIGNDIEISEALYLLVVILSELKELDQARHFLERLQQVRETETNPLIHQRYLLARATMLKHGRRAKDIFHSQRLFQRLAFEEPVIDHELTVTAMFHYCELLLRELSVTPVEEVLHEIKKVTMRLLTTAKIQRSQHFIAKAYFLQAKLSQLELNLERARVLFLQAQLMAEESGLEALARSIAQEHAFFLEQVETLKVLNLTSLPLDQRILVTRLEPILKGMTMDRWNSLTTKTMGDRKSVKETSAVTIGLSLGLFDRKFGMAFKGKSQGCPFDRNVVETTLNYVAILLEQGRLNVLYGPLPIPHFGDPRYKEWNVMIFGFLVNGDDEEKTQLSLASTSSDVNQIHPLAGKRSMILLFYQQQHESLILPAKPIIQDRLVEFVTTRPLNPTKANEKEETHPTHLPTLQYLITNLDLIEQEIRQVLTVKNQ